MRAVSEEEVRRLRLELVEAMARVCPGWLADRADDLVQVATMRALEALRRREGNDPLSSFYLRRAAYSAVVDEIRRLRRRRESPLEPEAAEGAALPVAEGDPERRAAGRDIARAIRSCLGRLARPRRAAVTLHLFGHSVPEAARLLGWTAKRAENLVYRGLADLRACLAAGGFTP